MDKRSRKFKKLHDEALKGLVEWFAPRSEEVNRRIKVWAAERYPDDPVSQEIASEMMANDVYKPV